jgi:SecD/SecF fusion protein
MKHAPVLRALLALAVITASLFIALTSSARLGLDLRGGTQIVLQTRSTDTVKAGAAATDRAVQVLRHRIDALGVTDPGITRAGNNRIIIELPGVQDPREAAAVIGRTAQLTFHPVLGAVDPTGAPPVPAQGQQVIADETGQRILIGPTALSGADVGDAAAVTDPQRGADWFVTVDFRGGGGTAWRTLTGAAACAPAGDPARRVAIVLDREVISSPQVDPSIGCDVGIGGGRTEITGRFSADEAKDLAVLIKGGALPVPVDVVEQRTVGPTLGRDAIQASAEAAVIGLVLTGVFITVVYRLAGLLATVALACYALVSYAALVALGATLTLPGLAGFVLAIGMAIDANVLVFERAREEYVRHQQARPRGLTAALRTGFSKAWTAILDSNMTTLLAAALLYLLASGPVRGFGVTLVVGVLASMVSALVIARVLVEWVVRRGFVVRRPRLSGLAGSGRLRHWLTESGPDLIRRSRLWLAISASIVVLAVAGIVIRGLNLGVEFTGGRLLSYSTSRAVSVEQARSAIGAAGFPQAVVQTSSGTGGASDQLSIRTEKLTNDEAARIETALASVGGHVTKDRDELIGPSLGAELRTKALIAMGAALVAQLIYLAIRFRWTFGLAAALAMLHDVLAVVGLFAWLGKPIDGVFLAAALTIVGLSVNDTVVTFDRVRELRRERPRDRFGAVVNAAILQTVPRTINTGLGAMFILGALTVLGGDSLTNFALALLVGLVVGTASSVFTASPLAVWLERRWPAEEARTAPRVEAGRRPDRRGRTAGAGPAGRDGVVAGRGDRWSAVDPYADVPTGREP